MALKIKLHEKVCPQFDDAQIEEIAQDYLDNANADMWDVDYVKDKLAFHEIDDNLRSFLSRKGWTDKFSHNPFYKID